MDPDAALARLRELAQLLLESPEPDASELAETFQGLDQWLARGGFKPAAWREAVT
jgi:hypothetical protein